MIPYLIAAIGAYLIGDSMKSSGKNIAEELSDEAKKMSKRTKEVLSVPRFAHSFKKGGKTDEDMSVQFIDYKDQTIMFEPHFKKYYSNDIEFDSISDAKKYIDSGSPAPSWERSAYRSEIMANGGKVVDGYVVYFSIFRAGSLIPVITEYHENKSDAEKSIEEKKAKKEKGWKMKELAKMPISSEVRISSSNENYKKVKGFLHSKENVDKFFEGKDSFYKKNYAWVLPEGYEWDNSELKKK